MTMYVRRTFTARAPPFANRRVGLVRLYMTHLLFPGRRDSDILKAAGYGDTAKLTTLLERRVSVDTSRDRVCYKSRLHVCV